MVFDDKGHNNFDKIYMGTLTTLSIDSLIIFYLSWLRSNGDQMEISVKNG